METILQIESQYSGPHWTYARLLEELRIWRAARLDLIRAIDRAPQAVQEVFEDADRYEEIPEPWDDLARDLDQADRRLEALEKVADRARSRDWAREGPRGKTMNKNPEDDIPLTNTGDVNAFEEGGGILYYQPEYNEFLWVFWDEPIEDETMFRVYMFRFGPDEDLLADSLSWAKEDIGSIASYVGTPKIELRRMARGTFLEKLRVAEDVRGYWGAENLDHYPYEATLEEMEKRYGDDLDKVVRRGYADAEAAYEQARRRSGNPTRKLKNKLLK